MGGAAQIDHDSDRSDTMAGNTRVDQIVPVRCDIPGLCNGLVGGRRCLEGHCIRYSPGESAQARP
jgi:hypothetical protein